jgi:hypothetical protein
LERQHFIFIGAASAAFAALIVFGLFNPLQQIEGDESGEDDVLKVRKGETVFVRYSSTVVKMLQDLPNRNEVDVEVSSELQVVNFAGLRGELRYPDMTITWFEDGQEESISEDNFNTIEYRFLPDIGNKTTYTYENVDYIAKATDAQLVVAVKPLSTAKVGEEYTVRIVMHTGGAVSYAIDDKTVQVVA